MIYGNYILLVKECQGFSRAAIRVSSVSILAIASCNAAVRSGTSLLWSIPCITALPSASTSSFSPEIASGITGDTSAVSATDSKNSKIFRPHSIQHDTWSGLVCQSGETSGQGWCHWWFSPPVLAVRKSQRRVRKRWFICLMQFR